MTNKNIPETSGNTNQVWLEKKVLSMNQEFKEFREWKIKHESESRHDSETLQKIVTSLEGYKGKGGIFGDGGLDDKLKELVTTANNIWKYIALTGIIVGLISNLDKLNVW